MSEKAAAHLRGIEGKSGADGKVTRAGVKAIVVHQPTEGHDCLPYGYFGSVEDARDYIRSMHASGNGGGLRVVKPGDVEGL